MGTSARRTAPLLLVLALVLGSLGLSALGSPSVAASAKGTVTGEVRPGGFPVKMRWFDADWNYLGARKFTNGIYSLSLAPGTYYLQFTDERPAYDVDKFAPTDLKVRIRAGDFVQKNVRMQPGAAITGTVKAGGKVAGGARVVAANANEQSFETKANDKGQFALGGLPPGSYSVFTYERTKSWVGRSTYVKGLDAGGRSNIAIALNQRAGKLQVRLRADGQTVRDTVFVTAVSKSTGQFWTTRARRGTAVFAGLFPGKYRLVAPGVGNFLPQTGSIEGGKVPSNGGADLVSVFEWTKRAASVQGYVVNAEHPELDLEGARVRLFAEDGSLLGTARTDATGQFFIAGQLLTQTGVTAVVDPDPANGSAYLGKDPYKCQFGTTSVPDLALQVGQTTQVGDIPLPLLPPEQQAGYPNINKNCDSAA
jgi:hypothetical protein